MEGIRYSLFSQRTILMLILLASLYTFAAGAFTTLFPVFGKKMLALGPVEVGYLWSWLGIGLFLVSLALVSLTQWETRKRVQVVSVSSVIGGARSAGLPGHRAWWSRRCSSRSSEWDSGRGRRSPGA